MKIGILTLPFNNNYGGYLQAYALMTILKREGHEVELIYRRHNRIPIPLSKKITISLKNIVKVLIGRKVASIIPNEEKTFRFQGASMMPFLDNYITPKSKPLYSSLEFNEYVTGRYDVVVVGSDQVWRPEYGPNIRDYFFCGIQDENLIRLSYAASFGTDKPLFTEEDRKACGNALEKFNAISVREESGLELLNNICYRFRSIPQLVLDPTLLLYANDYNLIIPKGETPSKDKVFCYVLDTDFEKEKIIDLVCEKRHKARYEISDIQQSNAHLPSIELWLAAIRDSDFVVTDSFHGMVFSVIFQKDFIICPNMKRGVDRFTSFLKQLNLEGRIVETIDQLKLTPINWEKVKDVLEEKRKISFEFIKGVL